MKKLIPLLVGISFLISIFSFIQPVKAINNFHMEIYPRRAGCKATYKFIATIEKTLKVHEYIKLGFPQGTRIEPRQPKDRNDPLFGSILEYYTDGSLKSLQFNSHIELDPSKEGYSTIVCTVPNIAGISLPENPGFYTYRFSTQAEPNEIRTQTEIIKESKISEPVGKPEIHIEPATPGAAARYEIGFNVGRAGYLSSGLLRLRFPEGTTMQKVEINPEWVRVNGVTLLSFRSAVVMKQYNEIVVEIPIEIKDSGRVTVEFDVLCGITNPQKAGKYQIEVRTLADPEWVKSYEFEITEVDALFKLSNYKVNHRAVYQILIKQNQDDIKSGDTIRVRFPSEVQIKAPLTTVTGKITINQQPIKEIREIEPYVYDLTAGEIEIKTGEMVDIQLDCPEIKNPVASCYIHLECKSPGMEEWIATPAVAIVPFALEIISVSLAPPNIRKDSTYTIDVIFGDIRLNTITIFLGHLNTTVTITPTSVLEEINTLVLPDIDNGSIPGTYLLKVSTDREPDGAEFAYTILPPTPVTDITQKGRRGKNGWWLSSPEVTLTSSDPEAVIWYWWNENEKDKRIYHGPIQYPESANKPDPLPLGQFKVMLYYQSVNKNGPENPNTKEIWVDSVSPDIIVENPKIPATITNNTTYRIAGRAIPIKIELFGKEEFLFDSIIYINNQKVTVNDTDGSFSLDIPLKEGENKVKIRAEDDAGNDVMKEYTIISDIVPPSIQMLKPSKDEVVLDKVVRIEGKTDDPTASVEVNGQKVLIESDGTFYFEMKIEKPGKKEIKVQAIDTAKNESRYESSFWFGYTITLQIGSMEAVTNGVNISLNVAPLIQKSKTLVPFRFIGEQLQASISYTTDPKTKLVKTVSYVLGNTTIVLTIGAKNASVNGKSVPLEVPAQIIKGSTMVPLRFIAENLNCQVEWESKQQIITITYPK